MGQLSASDTLPLTCTREGACCVDAEIRITPWELAVLARGCGLDPAAFRDRHTILAGTALRLDPPAAGTGPRACSLHRAGSGCSVHPSRPLACRLFPLGRSRADGVASYHHPGRSVGCADLCPASAALPAIRVGDYLASQQTGPGETAHDAYAAVLAGLVATASSLARAAAEPGFAADLHRLGAIPADGLARRLPAGWSDLLSIPELAVPLDEPALWVHAHRVRLAQAIATGWGLSGGLGEAAVAVAALALILGPALGSPPALVADAIAAGSRAAA